MTSADTRLSSFVGTTVFCLFGPLVWAIHFALVYGVHHVACRSLPVGGRAIELFVLLVTGVTIVVLGAAALRPAGLGRLLHARHEPNALSEFLVGTMRLLALLSSFGAAWAGSAALFVNACIGSP